MAKCKSVNCINTVEFNSDFCVDCYTRTKLNLLKGTDDEPVPMSQKYPKYYKSVEGMEEIDVYAVHHLFCIQDPSGAIQHASKKLLLSGARTGGKSAYDDIREARDTLTRWLQINKPD